MPRAHRAFFPGYVYHITHRCHQQQFYLKSLKEKQRYRYWLWQAVKRYQLKLLNYVITDNHVHLLVLATTEEAIPKSMQLIAGQTAREYINRKTLPCGAFWQGRYFATAIEKDTYFINCMIYIDLNMVRAGVVEHPKEWFFGGHYEYLHPRKRYVILDERSLLRLTNNKFLQSFMENYDELINLAISNKQLLCREPKWTEQKAIGTTAFKLLFEV